MSKFIEFRQQAESAIEKMTQAVDDYKQMQQTKSIQPCILTQLDQHITPISGPAGEQDYGIVQGKPDWRKNGLELVLRRSLLAIVVRHRYCHLRH
jgi:hypothetical protein